MPNIAYILCGGRDLQVPSTRISVLNIMDELRYYNFNPVILHESNEYNLKPNLDGIVERAINAGIGPSDFVYFENVQGKSAVKSAQEFRKMGAYTIFGNCDSVAGRADMAEVCDLVIVPSTYLKEMYPLHQQKKTHVAHDGIEHPESHKTEYSRHYGTAPSPMRAVLITTLSLAQLPGLQKLPDYVHVTVIGAYNHLNRSFASKALGGIKNLIANPTKEKLRYYALQLSKAATPETPQFERIPWDIHTVFGLLTQYDIGIVPVDLNSNQSKARLDSAKSKSANRVTQLMSVGLPVIASPIPAYLDIITTGDNGFIANSQQDWDTFFESLRDSKTREKIGRAARDSVLEQYSQDQQAKKLVDILNSLSMREIPPITVIS